jgi:hypothetical protein
METRVCEIEPDAAWLSRIGQEIGGASMRRRLRLLASRRNVLRNREARGMANIQLWLSNGETIQIRVEDADAELAALKSGTGRFTGEFTDLTGPALGIVRTEAIIAAIIR